MKFRITDPEITLAPHQKRAVDFIASQRLCIINYDTGTGKTLTCIQSLFNHLNEGLLEKGLIVCTKSSLLSFQEDILKTNYPKEKLITIKKKEDLGLVSKAANKLFLIQYETLLSINLKALYDAFKVFSSGLFIDEVHRVKTIGKSNKKKVSSTALALDFLKRGFQCLVGLTATTLTSNLEDYYRIVNFIKPKTLGGWNWFRENFFIIEEGQRWNKKIKKYVTYPKTVGYKNLDKLDELTKNVIIQYFPKLDYRFKVLTASLKAGSPRAERYEELAAETHGKQNNKHSSVMPKLQRLIDKSPQKKFLLKKVVEKCRDNGLIIFSRTRKSNMVEYIQSLLEEEGMEVRVISGSTKLEDRRAAVRWGFAGEPKNKAMVITMAGGQSLNCHWTNNLIFWEIPMGIGPYLQIKGRIGRMFSRWEYYNFWFLLIKDTIDEYWYLRFTAHKEIIGETASDSAIPTSKLNEFDGKKLKKLRDRKVWRKDSKRVKGEKEVKSHPILKRTKRLK